MIKFKVQTTSRLEGVITVYEPKYKELTFVVSRGPLGWALKLSTQNSPDFYDSLEQVIFALAAHEEGFSV